MIGRIAASLELVDWGALGANLLNSFASKYIGSSSLSGLIAGCRQRGCNWPLDCGG